MVSTPVALLPEVGEQRGLADLGHWASGTATQVRCFVVGSLYGEAAFSGKGKRCCKDERDARGLCVRSGRRALGHRNPCDFGHRAPPPAQALIQLQSRQYDKAIQTLQPVLQFERFQRAGFNAMFLSGQAYLGLGDGRAASAEFQKILDHRGLAPLDIRYPIAYLYLGRSARLEGDLAKSRKAYEDFLALWKDADHDIPILKEAIIEYEKLK